MHFGQLFAQSAFYYQHISNEHNKPFDILELDDSYVICGRVDTVGVLSDGYLLMMDKQGNVLWDKEYETSNVVTYTTLVNVKDGFMTGGYRWVNNKRRNLIKKFDYQGNELWEKLIGDTLVLGGDNLCRDLVFDNGYIFMATSGFDTVSSTTNAFLIKMDKDGNIIWQKNYGADIYEQRVDRLKKIEKIEDGFIIRMESQNMAWQFFPHILKVDFDGNEIWRKELRYYNSTTISSDTIIYFKNFTVTNNNHILAYFNREEPVTYNSSHIIIEFDNQGNELSFNESVYTESIAYANIFTNSKNEIFVVGDLDFDTVGLFFAEIFSAKFDCNKNLLWEKHYGEKNDIEFFSEGKLASDGGLLIAGWTANFDDPPFKYNSIVVKTDCNGKLEWNTESCINPTTIETTIFPNPFFDYINIHLPNIPKENKLEIKIFDLKGSLIEINQFENLNVIQLNLSKYSSGLYFVKITINETEIEVYKIIKY